MTRKRFKKFYDDLEEALDRKNNTHVIVMGDFNAKIGKKGKDENNNWIGNHEIGVRNERQPTRQFSRTQKSLPR